MIGKKQFFWLFLTVVFCGPWVLSAAHLPSKQDALKTLSRLDSLCKIHLNDGKLDSLWTCASNLKDLALGWKEIHPNDRQITFYLMAGYLHQGNVFNIESRNKEAVQRYRKALDLSVQISDSIKRHSIYNNIGILYFKMGHLNKAFQFHRLALWERIRMRDSVLLGDTYNSLGLLYLEWKRFEEAGCMFQQSIRYKSAVGVPTEKLAEGFNNLGRVWSNKGEWVLSSFYYGLSWRLFLGGKNPYGQVYVLNNLALVLKEFGSYKNAQRLLMLALTILPDKESIFNGDLHLNLGELHLDRQQTALAHMHFNLAMQTYQKLESSNKTAVLNRTFGNYYVKVRQLTKARTSFRQAFIYYESNQIFGDACSLLREYASTFVHSNPDSVEFFLKKSLQIADQEGLSNEMASALVQLGTHYLNSENLLEAIVCFERCLNLADLTESSVYLQEARNGLVHCYEYHGKWEQALKLKGDWQTQNKLNIRRNKQVYAKLNGLLLSQIQLQGSIRKTNKIGELRRQMDSRNMVNLMVLLGVLLALAVTTIAAMVIYLRQREQERHRIKLESDLIGLKGMINQHFMANTMNAIKALINQGKIDSADVYLNKFSALLRGALSQAKNTMIPLEEELLFIRLYIELEQLRFPGQIQFELAVDPQVETNLILVPAMLLQPIIENSVQHGRRGPDCPLNISLTLFPQAGRLVFLLQDDGIGIKVGKQNKQTNRQASFGIDLTEQRIKLLGNQYKVKVDFTVDEVLDSQGMVSGTRVIIEVPLTNTPYS